MKLSNFSIPVLRDAFQTAWSRFPLALISAFSFGVISIYLIESDQKEEEIQRIMFSLGIGLPWMTALHLIAENYLKSFSQKLILFGLGFLFLLFVFFHIAPDFDTKNILRPVRFLSFFLIAHLLVSIAPFLKPGNLREFWEYNMEALVIWFIAAFYAMVIYLGLLMGLVAIDNLFDMHIDYDWYIEIFVVIAAGFHPVYVLSNLPGRQAMESFNPTYSKAIRTISLYILMPLTILYFLILYAYGLKIVISWELPKGWVSSLVLGFSSTGLITYLLNYYFPDLNQNKLSYIFKKYFFFILTPLILLLFAAILRRLNDYGFTPPRYFVLVAGIWLFLTCLYFIFSKTDNIKLIPLSLILVLLLGTMSPFDAFNISSSSQFKRLKLLLEKNSALENGKIKSPLPTLDIQDKESIKEIIYVLDELNDIEKVNSLLQEPIQFDTISYYDPRDFLFEKIGLAKHSEMKFNSDMTYLSTVEKNEYNISGFDRMYLFNLNTNSSDENVALDLIDEKNVLICKALKDTINLNDILLKIDNQYQQSKSETLLEAPFDFNTSSNTYKIYIKHLNYQKSDSGFLVNYIHAALLVKGK